jgi:hypothetical protein
MKNLSARLILLAMTSLIFAACSEHSDATTPAVPVAIPATILSCNENEAIPAQTGVLLNNMWNRSSAGNGPWKQCLQSRVRNGQTDYGWSWSWPTTDGLYAYPELLVGRSPWQPTPTNDARFPRAVGNIQTLQIEYDIESQASGKKNLAVEFWITNTPPAEEQQDTRSIKTELMIWSDASDGLIDPQDKPEGTVLINGVTWTVYVKRNWGDVSGASGNSWNLVTYHAAKKTTSVTYDARYFLNDAIKRGLIDPTDYIWGVELGNEIVSGSGTTWIKSFQLLVK